MGRKRRPAPKNQPTKKCSVCNRTKRVGLYYRDRRQADGYQPKCKACHRKTLTGDPKANSNMKLRYGITLVEYEALLKQQGGGCYICGMRPRKKRLAVDHDHAVEKVLGSRRSVRGLLCTQCNRWLGAIRDDVTKARRAIKYLEKARPFDE